MAEGNGDEHSGSRRSLRAPSERVCQREVLVTHRIENHLSLAVFDVHQSVCFFKNALWKASLSSIFALGNERRPGTNVRLPDLFDHRHYWYNNESFVLRTRQAASSARSLKQVSEGFFDVTDDESRFRPRSFRNGRTIATCQVLAPHYWRRKSVSSQAIRFAQTQTLLFSRSLFPSA